MDLTDWDTPRIRRALRHFQLAKVTNGARLSWTTVAHKILMSEVTYHEYPEDGSEPVFRGEALRRFANGESKLQPDKLKDLARFLIAEKFLHEKELGKEPTELHNIWMACTYLTSKNGAYDYLANFCTFYRHRKDGLVETELRFYFDNSNSFFRVEETNYHMASENVEEKLYESSHFKLRKDENRREVKRLGYGFVSTGLNILHIFLCGASKEDSLTYIQSEHSKDRNKFLSLIKHGDSKRLKFIKMGKSISAPISIYEGY